MEAVVLAAVLALSIFTAGAGTFGALRLVMYLMDATKSPGRATQTVPAAGWIGDMAMPDRPATSEPSLAA
jgi:hypothetical protein